jgi:uncharacterized protein (TIGR02594 family)
MQDILTIALREYGTKELIGSVDNVLIKRYFDETGIKFVSEEVSHWCAVFVTWCAIKAGYILPTDRMLCRALNWQHIGDGSFPPDLGDIVVMHRGDPLSGTGHVGLFINRSSGRLNVLGGNQADQVCISSFPESQVIAYRRLVK